MELQPDGHALNLIPHPINPRLFEGPKILETTLVLQYRLSPEVVMLQWRCGIRMARSLTSHCCTVESSRCQRTLLVQDSAETSCHDSTAALDGRWPRAFVSGSTKAVRDGRRVGLLVQRSYLPASCKLHPHDDRGLSNDLNWGLVIQSAPILCFVAPARFAAKADLRRTFPIRGNRLHGNFPITPLTR